MTEEQRIAIIANAHRESKGLPTNSSVLELVADLQAETFVLEHGFKDVEQEDISDEKQFLLTDVAEEIDEEDQDMGVSDEMKGVYNDSCRNTQRFKTVEEMTERELSNFTQSRIEHEVKMLTQRQSILRENENQKKLRLS